jgi:hypothetical protein
MRWPWQRERIEPPTDDAGGGLQQQAAAPRVPPAGWAFLPPLQRTTANMQLISEPDHFTGALAAWGDPSFTSPMAHLVSTAAPAGIIDVDGGGPVRSDGAYPPSSVDMTLLPPPVPGSRPAPRKAGTQRSASDGVPSAGASGPVGPALTAAAGTFPVLQLYASPPEQTQDHPEYTAASEQAHAQPVQESDDSGALPATDVTVLPTAVDMSSAAIAPTSSQPIRTDGSTSDGSATYVPVPPPPVQRAQPATPNIAPALRKVPPSSKLGLGMPLAYSEPAGPPEPFAAAALSHITPQVQRSAVPESPEVAASWPSDPDIRNSKHPDGREPDGSDAEKDQRTGAAGTVPMPLFSPPAVPQPSSAMPVQVTPAVSVQATVTGSVDAPNEPGDQAAAGPGASEPSAPLPALATDGGGQERHDVPEVGPENYQPPAPSEPAVAPLLSAGGFGESIGSGDQSGTAGVPDMHMGNESGTSVLPVVSRFRPALADKPAPDDASGEPATSDAATEEPLRASLDGVPERTDDPPAAPPDPNWRGGPQNDDRELATGQAITPETPASHAAHPLQRAVESPTSLPVTSTFAPASTTTSKSYTAAQSHIASQGSTAPQRPLVVRMARTATAGSAPDSLQRLTEMPAAQQYAPLAPRSLSAATPGRAAQGSTSAVAPDSLPSLGGYPEPDARSLWPGGLPGINSPEEPSGLAYEPAAMQLSFAGAGAEPVEPPEVTAAVGRSIQRTLAPEGPASGAGRGPWSSPDSLRPADLVSATAGPTAQARTGGRGPVNLQRAAASSPAFHHPAGPHVGRSVFGTGAVTGVASIGSSNIPPTLDSPSGHAVLALALQPASRTGGDATTQRDEADPAPRSWQSLPARKVESAGGHSTAAGEDGSDAGASVQTDAGPPAARAVQPVAGTAADGPAGKQASGAQAATPEQLEDLAKRLTGPLIRRIKAEMLLDRERRGLRTDVN